MGKTDDLVKDALGQEDDPVSVVTKSHKVDLTKKAEPPAVSVSAEVLMELLKQVGAQNAEVLERVLSSQSAANAEAIKLARNRRPESYNGDFEYHGISSFNPEGAANPLPALKCPMFEALWDVEENKALDAFPIVADEYGGLDREERELLNQLQDGKFRVRGRDGAWGQVRVITTRDADGHPTKLQIAMPKMWVGKDERRYMKPSIRDYARQMVEQQTTGAVA